MYGYIQSDARDLDKNQATTLVFPFPMHTDGLTDWQLEEQRPQLALARPSATRRRQGARSAGSDEWSFFTSSEVEGQRCQFARRAEHRQ